MEKDKGRHPKEGFLTKLTKTLFRKKGAKPEENSLNQFSEKEPGKLLEIVITTGKGNIEKIIVPKKENYGIGDVCSATRIGTRQARPAIASIIDPNNENPARFFSSETPSFTESEIVKIITTITPLVSKREKVLGSEKEQITLPDGKKVIISSKNGAKILEKCAASANGIVPKDDFCNAGLTIRQRSSALQHLGPTLSAVGWEIVSPKRGSTYELRKKKAPEAPKSEDEDEKTSPLPNPHLLAARDKPLSFVKQQNSEERLRADIASQLLFYTGAIAPGSKTLDTYKFIEPLLFKHNLGFDVFIDKWFNKNEQDGEKAWTNRQKVKEKILKNLDDGLISKYKIGGISFSWENTQRAIAEVKKRASILLI